MSQPLYPRILIGLMLMMSSCSSDNDMPKPPNAQPAKPPNAQPKVPSNIPTIDNRNSFAPPRGAKYTIFAGKVEGDLHVQRANSVRDTLKNSTRMADWYVIHEAGKSLLYHGYYPSIDDAKAQQDRQKIDLMQDSMGNRPFQRALIVALNTPDPTAPPEWNLINAKGAYTLQIGVYQGTPERKQAAVDAVRAARGEGVEAYFFHGETASLVCVGAWPMGAVLAPESVESPRGADRNKPLMVVPATNDPELNKQFEQVAANANLQLVRNNVQILDPTLDAAIKRFPHNAINGMEMKRVVEGKEAYAHSLVLPIPRGTGTEADAQASPNNPNPAYTNPAYRPEIPRAFDPPPQQQQGRGRLRSIGG